MKCQKDVMDKDYYNKQIIYVIQYIQKYRNQMNKYKQVKHIKYKQIMI